MKKSEKAKKRSYKIQELGGVPSINIRGKFLEKLGVEVGSYWELSQNEDMIILKKVPQIVVDYNEAKRQLKQSQQAMIVCENRVKHLSTMVAESRESYSVDDELIKSHEKNLQAENLQIEGE